MRSVDVICKVRALPSITVVQHVLHVLFNILRKLQIYFRVTFTTRRIRKAIVNSRSNLGTVRYTHSCAVLMRLLLLAGCLEERWANTAAQPLATINCRGYVPESRSWRR